MRKMIIALAAAALVTGTTLAAPPADPQYRIVRIIRDADGNETSRVQVELFVEKEAPAVTLGGRLLALHNGDGGEYVAEPMS